MTENIAGSLSRVAASSPQRTGLVEASSGKKYTFSYLERKSNQYGWHLRKCGVRPGDRVMLMVKPSADFICLTFALFKLGAPVILIDPGMGYKNLLRCVKNVAPEVFIGIPKAHLFMTVYRSHFSSVRRKFCVGGSLLLFGPDLRTSIEPRSEKYPVHHPSATDLAAIIFTTGSTGPPKGVRYEHSIFSAQLDHIRNFYSIGPDDIDQPAFPLFALFSIALGACAVIPDMDPTRPAQVDPQKFVTSLRKYRVTYSFGSPALWNVITPYCIQNRVKLDTLRTVLMAGAPVPGELIEKMYSFLPHTAEIHTPYGATECLPIVDIEGREIVGETWAKTRKGAGTCVGRPLPGIAVEVIRVHDGVIDALQENDILPAGEIGEIIVSGDVVTRSYEKNDRENALAKISHQGKLWHRIGDVGYKDTEGRLWFCGRKAHRVLHRGETLYTIRCEAIFNNHKDVFRSALVGIPSAGGKQKPAVIIEKMKGSRRADDDIIQELRDLAKGSEITSGIEHFLFHPSFPVDIRHNAKIFREKLAVWAAAKISP